MRDRTHGGGTKSSTIRPGPLQTGSRIVFTTPAKRRATPTAFPVVSPAYSLAFLILAATCASAGLAAWDVADLVAVAFPFFSALVSFGLLAVAYAGAGPGLFLKRADGRRSPAGWVLFAPYFLLNAVTFALYRAFSREPAWVRVAPNLFFGRRLSAREAEEAGDAGWVGVLDLAGEFAEVRPLRGVSNYLSLPMLDGVAPGGEKLRRAVEWLTRALEAGPVYVHCALGHGRSGCVVIAYLLSAGLAGTVGEGARLLRGLRSGVRLSAAQRRRVRAFERRAGDEA